MLHLVEHPLIGDEFTKLSAPQCPSPDRLDRCLNTRGDISSGLADTGDRLFSTCA